MIDIKRYHKSLKNFLLDYLYRKDIYKRISESYTLLELSKATSDKIVLGVSVLCLLGILKDLNDFIPEFRVFKSNMATVNDLNDQEYLEVKKEYDEYVKEIAKEIKKLNLQDPLEMGIYFTLCLHKGLYSKNGDFYYKTTKKDKDTLYNGILGARVVSGFGVCRNMAALLTDVYRELGIDADYIGVNIKKIMDTPHACVLVSSKEGSFIIDPTWQSVLTLDKEKEKGINNTKFYGDKFKDIYSLIDYEDDEYYYELIDQEYLNSKEKSRYISDEELKNKYFEMSKIAIQNHINRFFIPDDNNAQSIVDENRKRENKYSALSDLEQNLTANKKR